MKYSELLLIWEKYIEKNWRVAKDAEWSCKTYKDNNGELQSIMIRTQLAHTTERKQTESHQPCKLQTKERDNCKNKMNKRITE